MVGRRRGVAQHLDAGGEHHLHRDLSRRRRAAPATGLAATYFDNADFTGTTVARIDPTVNFDWGVGLAGRRHRRRHVQRALDRPGRRRQFTRTYTFYTQSDDGVRLWVNGVQVVNNWTDHALDREQRHDRADRRAALRHPDGVLRERRAARPRGCCGAARRSPKAVVPREPSLSRGAAAADRDPDQLPAGGGAGAGRLPRRRRPRLRQPRQRPDLRLERSTTRRRPAIATRRTRPISATTR